MLRDRRENRLPAQAGRAEFLVRFALGVKTPASLTPGLVQGQKLEQVLPPPRCRCGDSTSTACGPVSRHRHRSGTGQPVVWILATWSQLAREHVGANVFSPCSAMWMLVDGGLVDNLPIDTALDGPWTC
jgi:hypothetical protein